MVLQGKDRRLLSSLESYGRVLPPELSSRDTQATRSASICTLQTAWSRLFPVATLKSSLKTTQEF